MTQHLEGADELLTTFSHQRLALLKHTADVLCAEESRSDLTVSPRVAQLSAILVSSLEELKVAEEELAERVAALSDLRDDLEKRVRSARQLFDLAPACLLVTDSQGHILEANRAFQVMLKRDFSGLERQPLTRFIAADERRSFRDGLSRLVRMDGVNDWRLRLVRPTDGPLAVSVAVHVVKPLTTSGGTRLFWSIRVVEPSDAPIDA